MKKIILVIFWGLISNAIFSQDNYNIGDTIYYKNNSFSYYRTTTFVVLLDKNVNNQANNYLVEKYNLDTEENKVYKESKFTTIGLGELRADGLFTQYYKNGTKFLEGKTNNGQRLENDLWKYYYPNGNLKSEEKLFSKSLRRKVDYPKIVNFWNKDGTQTVIKGNGIYEYENKNGEVEVGTLNDGLKVGLWKATKNGKVIYEETYKKGKFVSGVSFDNKGNKYSYKQIDEEASYKTGGIGVVRQHVVKNFNQNTIAVRGVLEVWFDIDKKGNISNIRVVKQITDNYNSEIVRIVNEMEGWKPACHRGQPVNSLYKLSINFK